MVVRRFVTCASCGVTVVDRMFHVSAVTFDPEGLHAAMTGETSPVVRGMRRLSRRIESRAKMRAPVDTGRLRQSIGRTVDVDSSGGHVSARVFAAVDYARFVHEGTEAHVIRPRYKQALKFEQNGRTRFATVVHHPGTKPRPFLVSAAREEIARLGG